MKKLKVRSATLCQFILYMPVIILSVGGFCALFLESLTGGILFFVCLGAALFYLIKLFDLFLLSDLFFSKIRYWKKDRMWFVIESDFDENDILSRIKKHGVLWEKDGFYEIKPLLAKYKRCYSHMTTWSSIEKNIVLYREKNLDEFGYKMILESAQNIVFQMEKQSKASKFFKTKAEQKAPACRSMAVIIIADNVSEEVETLVRCVTGSKESFVLPCVIDLHTDKCYFDGMKSVEMVGGSAKNVAIDLIKKIVFKGHLPLKNNNEFDYSKMDIKDLEKSLIDFIKEFYREKTKQKFL